MTKIEWTDKVWNPVTGCTKVSEGCRNCYAEKNAIRWWGGRPFTDVLCHPDRLEAPLHWRKPRRVFVNSMSDLFHEAVPFEFIERVFLVMSASVQHTFQVLTKRPERMEEFCARRPWFEKQFRMGYGERLVLDHTCSRSIIPNVWLGVSIEDQATADERIPLLLQTSAAVRFVSAEPLLGPVDIRAFLPEQSTGFPGDGPGCDGIDWIIVGGESQAGARPMHPDWARSIRDQCQSAGAPFFFKQWGEWAECDQAEEYDDKEHARHGCKFMNNTDGGTHDFYTGGVYMRRVGKKAAGRELDGRIWDEMPEEKP